MLFAFMLADAPGVAALRAEVRPAHKAHLAAVAERIAFAGPLLADDGDTWLGTAVLLQAPDREAARAVLTADRYADVEVHPWRFGGRPS